MKSNILSTLAISFLLLLPAYAASSPKELLATGHADETIQILQQQTGHSVTDADAYNLLCRAYFIDRKSVV